MPSTCPGTAAAPAPARFTLEGVVAALDDTFEPAGPPLTIVGWSLGGLVAMRWALARPDRVRRLVLVATSPRFVARDDWPHAMAPETLDRFGDELRIAWKLTVQRFLALQLQGSETLARHALGTAPAASRPRGAFARDPARRRSRY